MSAIIPESLSSQAQTALRWFSLFAQSNFDELETVLMDDFMHYVRPASAGVPPGDKVESVFNWMGFRELFDGEVKVSPALCVLDPHSLLTYDIVCSTRCCGMSWKSLPPRSFILTLVHSYHNLPSAGGA
jgi:hypothetical protein